MNNEAFLDLLDHRIQLFIEYRQPSKGMAFHDVERKSRIATEHRLENNYSEILAALEES